MLSTNEDIILTTDDLMSGNLIRHNSPRTPLGTVFDFLRVKQNLAWADLSIRLSIPYGDIKDITSALHQNYSQTYKNRIIDFIVESEPALSKKRQCLKQIFGDESLITCPSTKEFLLNFKTTEQDEGGKKAARQLIKNISLMEP